MPFGVEFDEIFHELLQPALADYEVIRADSRLDERNILEKIVTGISEAALIVADVTGMNADVMYELGISHALGRPTIMVAETVTGLPFDIRSYPVHEYGVARARADRLSSLLRELAARHREGLLPFGNPVTDFLNRPARSPAAILTETDYTGDMCVEDMTWAADQTGKFFDRFNELGREHTERLASAIKKIGPRGTTTPMDDPGIRDAAEATRDFAQRLEELAMDFHEVSVRFMRAIRWVLAPERRPYVGEDDVRRYVDGARASSRSLDGVLGVLAELRHVQGTFPAYSGNLAHALATASTAISNMINEIMTAKTHFAWILKQDPGSA